MSPTAAACAGWRAVHVLLSLKPLSQQLRKSGCPWTWKQDHSTSNKLCSFEGLGVCTELLLSLMWSWSVSWLRESRCGYREQRGPPNRFFGKLGIYLGIDRTAPRPSAAITKILLKRAGKRPGKTEVMCFRVTAEHLVNKENCLRKNIGVCHLCDPLRKVNMLYIEKIFSKLLITNIANNFLLTCLNLASVFSLVSHSADVFSIWHSKILVTCIQFCFKKMKTPNMFYIDNLWVILETGAPCTSGSIPLFWGLLISPPSVLAPFIL